jgi:hypothetical protein
MLGKCSCLKADSFRVGDRVRVVYTGGLRDNVKVGDYGIVKSIWTNGCIGVSIDFQTFWKILQPQNLVPVR